MEESNTLITILTALSPILIAIIAGLFAMETRKGRQQQKIMDERAAIRARESRLSLRLMFSTVLLSDATAMAVQNQKVNGEMTEARKEAFDAKADYERFMQELLSDNVGGVS